MNTLEINGLNGKLTINGTIIAPINVEDFLANVVSAMVSPEVKRSAPGCVTYCLDGRIRGERFGVNVTYKDEQLDSVWLSWAGGISGVKGYATSEAELIQDRNKLSRLLSNYLTKKPDEVTNNHDVFVYAWGYISVACSIRSSIVSVGLHWEAGR